MSDGKYGGHYDPKDGNCFVCGTMLNDKNECGLCDSIEAPLLKRIAELEAKVKTLKGDLSVANRWLKSKRSPLANELLDYYRPMEAELKALRDPDWKTYIAITTQWLEKYPPDIFTGVSGDPGPLFVVAIRKALAELLEVKE